MLIRYSVENFMSFKDRETLTLIPGKGTLKSSHKNSAIKGIKTLKSSIVYGANASGKSNLIKAIDFGRRLVLKGVRSDDSIKYKAHRLDVAVKESNSRIEYEIQHKGKNYAYGFVFNSNEIVEEWLYEFGKKSESMIFERNIKNKDHFNLDPLLKRNKNSEEQQFLAFTAKGTPENQLFLTEIKTRRVKENVSDINDLLNVLDWFQNALKVIFPNDKYKAGIKSELKSDSKIQQIFEELLNYFGTGIDGICLNEIKISNLDIPNEILEDISSELEKSEDTETNRIMLVSPKGLTYFFSRKEGKLIVEKFMTKHNVKGQERQELFDTSDESDGTNRIIDFIPLILDLLKGDNVFIIDEMERSLHPNLIYEIFDLFLSKSEGINSQLIVASHESTLLTQKLLRKDEIWFVVKNDGASHLHSLEDYNIRFDKQIRKDYLLGRYKGVPSIGNRGNLTVLPS
ncbi:AAA family ATPase [Saccharicrinis aurantiacus]|uniref:AAA family ATPase n=1 Tax=Saccharicrinis aurantiacus TaxID=1849719 RepID=UPI0008389DC6|nr:ATP-binding protein [Saccharicrinis aurantiacus]